MEKRVSELTVSEKRVFELPVPEKRMFELTVPEYTRLMEKIIHGMTPPEPEQKAEPKMLYSIKELADFLQCSTVTAQKIKNSGRIPYSQTGRKVVFEGNAVLQALSYQRKK